MLESSRTFPKSVVRHFIACTTHVQETRSKMSIMPYLLAFFISFTYLPGKFVAFGFHA